MSVAALRHLRRACPHMRGLIRRVGPCGLAVEDGSPYEALVRAIAHQQLNGKAARTITGRFLTLYPGPGFPPPEAVLATEEAALRGCGFSGRKAASIRAIAEAAAAGVVPTRAAARRMTDEALVERLTPILGIGRWTVEMLLMFTLGRPDIWPVDDWGVREGVRILFELEAQPKPREIAEWGARYAPHRSVAAWYLWRAVDEARAKS